MDSRRIERPKLKFFKGFTPYIPWISIAITVIAFVLSGQELTLWSALILIIIIIALACLIYLVTYIVRYAKYLFEMARNHARLMQLYGEKESELIEKDRIISSHQTQLASNLVLGVMRSMSAKSNESMIDMIDKDINILGKRAGENGVELIFDVGSKVGIEENTLLSIVTMYGDLWGVVLISHVNENDCTGHALSRINENFWRQIEEDMSHDPSPPPSVKARLYCEEDLITELKLVVDMMESEVSTGEAYDDKK